MRVKLIFAGLVTLLIATVGVRTGAQTQDGSNERKLELRFDGNGYVTLVAQNVSVSDVFAEWAKVGGTKITNAEKLPRGPISVQFDKTPEQKLVESLVRLSKAQNPGWIAVPRQVDAPVTPSRLQAISILPMSSPTQTYTTTTSNVAPLYQQNTSDDEVPPVMPVIGGGPASQPAPRPQQQQPPTTTGGPGAPVGGPGLPGSAAPLPGATGRGRGM